MPNRLLFIFFVNFCTIAGYAQSGELLIRGTSPGIHITHVVAPKENWYSIGRLYNISPKEIAPFNGATLDNPLSINQQVKIPLTPSNFAQNEAKAADEVFIPVYHIVQEKEWLYRISTTYNKVPIESLEKWNNINKDQAKAGMKLVVGYLKVKKDQSALAASGSSTVPGSGTPPQGSTQGVKAEVKNEEPVVKREIKQEQQPLPQEQKRPEPVENRRKEETSMAAEKQPVMNKSASEPEAATTLAGGYFRSLYEQSGKTATGSSGIFKSTSGWQDAKFYALMNNVAIGTVVAVSNPANGKTVYAKVLGQLPDMKESNGLTIRVSDAAASELGAGDARFPVNVKY